MTVGERMKTRRKELNISADIVAEKLGVSRSTIFRYEKGDIEKLPTNKLADIAEILQTTPAYLMGWDTDNEKKLISMYNQLSEIRQKKVYNFAENQLHEQNSIIPLNNSMEKESELYTLAAHSSDPDKKYTEEEIKHIQSVLAEARKKHLNKNDDKE
ncbi:MAG: helix-turn-helix transcriptional regulator [Enterococcus thailandicus]|nr:helix-turn-helix transcriptional regulator [Enterococcus thailandicus]